MADWVTISSLATAGGTLVLAVATFGSVRSANRAARVAERSLLVGVRPLLIPSHEDDPVEYVRFGDGVVLTVEGHGAIAVRNGGTGLAVIHGWRTEVAELTGGAPAPTVEDFRRQTRDLYIPAGYSGFWQGAVRDRDDPSYDELRAAAESQQRVMVDLLYGDYDGGQRTITRFGINRGEEVGGDRAEVLRYWNVYRDDPR